MIGIDHQVNFGTYRFANQFYIFNILFYEFTSTTFFTYCVMIYGGATTLSGVSATVVGMFVAFLWSARFTGTYMNPALIIACMIKKERSIPVVKGIAFIGTEIVASFAGTFIAWYVGEKLPEPFSSSTDINSTGILLGKEVIGTFLYVSIVLILISTDTTFVEM